MRLILKFILQILANALAVFAAAHFIPQIIFNGNIIDYLVVGLILAVANTIIKPILKIISAPLIFITLGLFIIVINGIILFGVDWFVEELIINGFWGYFWGVIILSLVNAILVGSIKKKKRSWS